jgi:tape measure domain-containing protein
MATQTTTIKVVADTAQAERALGGLQTSLKGLVTVAAAGAIVSSFLKIADAATNLENKMRQVTAAGQTSTQLFAVIGSTANSLGATIEDVGDLFYRLSLNTKDLNISQRDTLRITELLIKGFQLTGASVAETQGAVIQLGQAFGQGVLRGDELRSVMEGLPLVAQALADKFGVQRGALKALGEQGKISSRDLRDAILASGQALDTAFTNRIPTVQNAFNSLSNTFKIYYSQTEQGKQVQAALGLALIKIATVLVQVINFFEKWGKIILYVVTAITLLYAPVRAALFILTRFGSIVTALFGPFMRLYQVVRQTSSSITRLFAGGVMGAMISGIAQLGKAIADLFGSDKTKATDKYKQAQDELNKALGIDGVQASEAAAEAQDKLTTQQISDADKVKKATIDRNQTFKELIQEQERLQNIGQGYYGAELEVQNALAAANKSLVREIKNDKGEIIGYTQGMTSAEQAQLETLLAQNQQLKLQREIAQAQLGFNLEVRRLGIADLDTREQQAAVDAKRVEYGQLLTREMENQIRAQVQQQQAARNLLAIDQARRDLAGTRTFAEKIQRGTGLQEQLFPQRALETQNKMDMDALQSHLDAKLITEQEYEEAVYRLRLSYAEKQVEINQRLLQTTVNRIQREMMAQKDLQNFVLNQSDRETLQRVGAMERQMRFVDSRIAFEKKSEQEKTQFVIQQGADAFNALGAHNKKAFEAAKAFNIANAIMNTFLGASQAVKMYPPPFSYIAVAAQIALGLAQVAQIRSQQYSGRALGGPMVGGQGYLVGERGPEIFTPSTAGTMTPNNQLAGGATNVTFNIVANDTRGFDQLLLERRPLITKIIRDAQLEQGRRQI